MRSLDNHAAQMLLLRFVATLAQQATLACDAHQHFPGWTVGSDSYPVDWICALDFIWYVETHRCHGPYVRSHLRSLWRWDHRIPYMCDNDPLAPQGTWAWTSTPWQAHPLARSRGLHCIACNSVIGCRSRPNDEDFFHVDDNPAAHSRGDSRTLGKRLPNSHLHYAADERAARLGTPSKLLFHCPGCFLLFPV